MSTHYVCTGGCLSLRYAPTYCSTPGCPRFRNPLTVCECEDDKHGDLLYLNNPDREQILADLAAKATKTAKSSTSLKKK